MKKVNLFLFLILFGLLLSGCDAAQMLTSDTKLQAWIDAPLDQATLPLAPYELVVHGSDPVEIKAMEISIDDQTVFTEANPNPSELLVTSRFAWNPPGPGEYIIKARSQNSSESWSKPAVVSVTVTEETSTPSLIITTTATVTQCLPVAEVNMNAACRLGPTTYHLPVIYLLEGDNLPILGSNLDQTWWAVQAPDLEGPCWVSGQTVTPLCLPEEISYIASPPYITRITISNTEFYWGDNPRQQITIRAQIDGENPISTARIVYHLQGKNQWYNTGLVNTSELIWEGSLNSHSINGFQEVNSAILEYYLEATDDAGLKTKSPILDDIKLKKVP